MTAIKELPPSQAKAFMEPFAKLDKAVNEELGKLEKTAGKTEKASHGQNVANRILTFFHLKEPQQSGPSAGTKEKPSKNKGPSGH